MTIDVRIMASLPSHPKTRKLIKRHGQAAAWNLICLFIFARENRPNGNFSGLTVEDLELASDWSGDDGQFVQALLDVGFLDKLDDGFQIHDWAKHNPWSAGAEMRSEKSRWAALCMRHGKAEAAQMMPEYANRKNRASQNEPVAQLNEPVAHSSSAPSPSPSPSPSPKSKTKALALSRFAEFWVVYPRRDDRAKAEKAWSKLDCDKMADVVIAGAKRYAADKAGSERQFIAMPTTWLNGRRWEDEQGDAPKSGMVKTQYGNIPSDLILGELL